MDTYIVTDIRRRALPTIPQPGGRVDSQQQRCHNNESVASALAYAAGYEMCARNQQAIIRASVAIDVAIAASL